MFGTLDLGSDHEEVKMSEGAGVQKEAFLARVRLAAIRRGPPAEQEGAEMLRQRLAERRGGSQEPCEEVFCSHKLASLLHPDETAE